MEVLSGFEPHAPFTFFEEITALPRGSHNEGKIGSYLLDFAAARGLEAHQDAAGNVIIVREATPGHEQAEPLILQAHMDMVCDQEPWSTKDMSVEGVDLLVEGDTITADGTTLGADDGAGIAYILAVLDDNTLVHPRLEAVFTVGEESCLVGASALDVTPLRGKRLINLDGENDGVIMAACAGAAETTLELPCMRAPHDRSARTAAIAVTGLTGGHSGADIHKGRANAIHELATILRTCADAHPTMRLAAFAGGAMPNAIPSNAHAIVSCPDVDALIATAMDVATPRITQFSLTDPQMRVIAEPFDAADQLPPATRTSTQEILAAIAALPNGVMRMSDHTPGMTETSLNCGVAKLEQNVFAITLSLRSAVMPDLQALVSRVRWIARAFGATCTAANGFPAWEWVEDSALRTVLGTQYRKLFNRTMTVASVHAGIECGLIASKIPGLDAVSIGPDIINVHTPNERLSISSFASCYRLLQAVIEELA